MDGTWSLDELYLGFDDPKYTADFEALNQRCAEFAALAAENLSDGALVRSYLLKMEAIQELAEKLGLYAGLRMSANTSDADAATWSGRIEEALSATAGPDAALRARIASMADLDKLESEDPLCGEYRYLLSTIQDDAKYLLSDKEEEILSRMNLSGASAWENLHSQLTSSLEVDYRGEKTTLSSIRNLAYDPDPEVRRAAYEAELAAYPKVAEAAAFSMNSIKQQVLTECSLRGFGSPLEQTLHNARMTRATLDAMLEAIEDYLPRFRTYLRRKGQLLGHENGLPWYDLFAPMGASSRRYSVEEAKEVLLSLFGKFDESLQTMA
ncbi:MAG: peptidase M3, partial [Oscillospiraceae bacterium]|nr:peptidase M3 [Oscillospiraceae bacterium]